MYMLHPIMVEACLMNWGFDLLYVHMITIISGIFFRRASHRAPQDRTHTRDVSWINTICADCGQIITHQHLWFHCSCFCFDNFFSHDFISLIFCHLFICRFVKQPYYLWWHLAMWTVKRWNYRNCRQYHLKNYYRRPKIKRRSFCGWPRPNRCHRNRSSSEL